jgi:hypothetical protein
MFEKKNALIAAAFCLVSANANAAVARLDMTGFAPASGGDRLVNVTLFFDTNTASNPPGAYQAVIIEGTIVVGETTYTARTPLGANELVIQNDNDLGFDGFGLQAEIESDDGDTGLFLLTLYDSSQSLFDSRAIPLIDFGLDDFDPFDPNSTLQTSFGLFGVNGVIGNGVEISELSYTVVPLPAAGWLFLSTLAGFGFLRRR